MENNLKNNTVLDLLFRAANSNPSKTYCKSDYHEFTYQQFITACITLSNKITKKNINNKRIGIFLPNSILFRILPFSFLAIGQHC